MPATIFIIILLSFDRIVAAASLTLPFVTPAGFSHEKYYDKKSPDIHIYTCIPGRINLRGTTRFKAVAGLLTCTPASADSGMRDPVT
jgi:hypothetical protein